MRWNLEQQTETARSNNNNGKIAHEEQTNFETPLSQVKANAVANPPASKKTLHEKP